jgi:hypothetical protein
MGTVAAFACASTASAFPLNGAITSTNGEGRFDDTLSCADGGDGPSWRYGYSGLTSGGAPLAGVWTGTVEVHASGRGSAFVPAGDGRLALRSDRGGTAHLEFGRGGCDEAELTLGTDANGEPVATGTLPIAATDGDGTLRGLQGSGTATFSFGLGAGADNPASLSFSGAFTVDPPVLAVTDAVPYYASVADFIARRATVNVFVKAADGAGDAYAVRLTAAKLGSGSAIGGVPATIGRINARNGRWTAVKFAPANPNTTYTLKTTVEGTDSIDAPVAPVTQSRTIKTPATF